MKVQVTLICENDAHISKLGDNPQKKLDMAYELFAVLLSSCGNDNVKFVKAEVIDEGKEEN